MKTLGLMKSNNKVNFVPSVCDCGHVWSLHVTYLTAHEIITHGPVTVGATDTLYGTMEIVSFVCRMSGWARKEMWESWGEGMEGQLEMCAAFIFCRLFFNVRMPKWPLSARVL